MAFKVTDGMSFLFSSTFGTAKTATAITNAAPPVASSVAHGFANGDELLLGSNWERITDSIVRASGVAADTLQLAGLDTTSTAFYAAGGGAGTTLRKVTGWQEVPQVETYDVQGGDPVFKTIKLLKRVQANTFPTGGFDPVRITLKMVYDPSLAGYQALLAISRAVTPVAFKMQLADAALSASYGYGNLIVKESPVNEDGVLKVTATFTALGLSVSY